MRGRTETKRNCSLKIGTAVNCASADTTWQKLLCRISPLRTVVAASKPCRECAGFAQAARPNPLVIRSVPQKVRMSLDQGAQPTSTTNPQFFCGFAFWTAPRPNFVKFVQKAIEREKFELENKEEMSTCLRERERARRGTSRLQRKILNASGSSFGRNPEAE